MLETVVKGDLKASFLITTTLRCRERRKSFVGGGLLHFTRDTNLIVISVKQSGIKYHF